MQVLTMHQQLLVKYFQCKWKAWLIIGVFKDLKKDVATELDIHESKIESILRALEKVRN